MKIYMNEIQQPIYLRRDFVWDPTAYPLRFYKDRSIFQSNVIEYWAPITDIVIPGIKKNNYWVSSWGNTWNISTQSPIGLSIHTKDYLQSHFMAYRDGNYKSITMKIHRIIMKSFCYFPGCDNFSINHIDCNKRNNNLYNLEWCTESENTLHGIENGTRYVFGNRITYDPNREVPEDIARNIRRMYCSGFRIEEIMVLLNLTSKFSFQKIKEVCQVE